LAAAGAASGALTPEAHKLALAVIALSLLVSPLWFIGARRAHDLVTRGITEADALFRQTYARELFLLSHWTNPAPTPAPAPARHAAPRRPLVPPRPRARASAGPSAAGRPGAAGKATGAGGIRAPCRCLGRRALAQPAPRSRLQTAFKRSVAVCEISRLSRS